MLWIPVEDGQGYGDMTDYGPQPGLVKIFNLEMRDITVYSVFRVLVPV